MTYIKEWFTWYHELIWKVFKEENSSQTNPNVHWTLILESRSENFQYVVTLSISVDIPEVTTKLSLSSCLLES